MIDITTSVLPELKPYQHEAIEFMVRRDGVMLFLEPGMGKTVCALLTLTARWRPGESILVVCPKVAIGTWIEEIPKWLSHFDPMVDLYTGDEDERAIGWGQYAEHEYFEPDRLRFMVCPYSQLPNLRAIRAKWTTVIADESHYLKNQDTHAFNNVVRLKYDRIYLLTGTPASQGPKDLWTSLHLIDQKKFGSYWAYVNRYCIVLRGHWGTKIEGPKNPHKIRELLQPYMYRKRKQDVLEQLTKTRPKIPVRMGTQQETLYDTLLNDLMAQVDDGFVLAQNGAVLTMKLRRMLVSPALIGSKAPSASMEALKDKVHDLGQPVVIGTAFRDAIPIIAAALGSRYEVHSIMGGLSAMELKNRIAAFELSKKQRRVLICTIKMGQSFSIQSTSYSIVIGPEWSPTDNTQFEDRIWGLGRNDSATVYYIVNDKTVEELIVEVVSNKMKWTALSIDDLPRRD